LQTVSVSLGDRSYPIYIGDQLLADASMLGGLLSPHIAAHQVAVFTNQTIRDLYGAQVEAALPDYAVDFFVVGDGEKYKNLESYSSAMDFLMTKRHHRSTCLIALGGGVVGDLTGFVAATFQRGVNFIQIPTTLLAQVDSSVGGKTAVNHPSGKNMIGAFYQPRAVIADSAVLGSLPEREYVAGLAEAVKYGVIADAQLFDWMEANADGLLRRDVQALAHVIKRSVEIKADVVARDERESGVRAILNFGHTFGHAIESLAGYGTWLHGEAVAIGMVMAARLSEEMRMLPQGQALRIAKLLQALQLPVSLGGDLNPEQMMSAMGMDKKASDGRLRFVVCSAIGEASVTEDHSPQALQKVLAESG